MEGILRNETHSDGKFRNGFVALGSAIASLLAIAAIVMAGALTSQKALTPAAGDPLSQPAAVEFRAGERAEAPDLAAGDPLTQPAAVEFRAGERAEAP